MSSVTDKYKIGDKNTKQGFQDVEKDIRSIKAITDKTSKKSFEIMNREIKKTDVSTLEEGKRYIDQTSSGLKRLIFRVGNKLYKQDLSEL